jgi:hypothetical protein
MPDQGGLFEDERCRGDEEDPLADTVNALAGMKPRSVRELDDWIKYHVRFDVEHMAQGRAARLRRHGEAVQQALAKPGRGKKVIPITFEHVAPEDTRADSERTYGNTAFKLADGQPHRERWSGKTTVAPRCEHAVLGCVVAGDEHYGRTFEVCIAREKCQVHWKTEMAAREKNARLREAGNHTKAERNEADERKRRELEQKKQQEEARRAEIVEGRAIDQAVNAVKELTPPLLRNVLASLLSGGDVDHQAFTRRFGVKIDCWRVDAAKLESLSGRTLTQAIVFCVLSSAYRESSAGVRELLQAFKVDVKKIEVEVIAAERAKTPAAPELKKQLVQTSAKPATKKTPATKKKPAKKKKGGR